MPCDVVFLWANWSFIHLLWWKKSVQTLLSNFNWIVGWLLRGFMFFWSQLVCQILVLQIYAPVFASVCLVAQSCLTLRVYGLWPAKLLCPWDFPSKNTGVDCHFFSQDIFPTKGLNPHLLSLRQWQEDSLPLYHLGSPGGVCMSFVFFLNIVFLSANIWFS